MTATSQDAISAIVMTQNIEPQYSEAPPAEKATGMNPAAVTSVPVSIGNAVAV